MTTSTALATVSTGPQSLTSIQATRTNKKGVQSTRDLLGLMLSGSRAERTEAAATLVSIYWGNGQFAPLAQQVVRVYGKDVASFMAAVGMDPARGVLMDNAPLQVVGGNRGAWIAIVAGLTRENAAKPYKGERAMLLQALEAHIKSPALAAPTPTTDSNDNASSAAPSTGTTDSTDPTAELAQAAADALAEVAAAPAFEPEEALM